MNVVNRKISEIKPYEKNAKIHDEKQIANVAESIKQFGFVQPVVVDKNDVIVIGHCRVLAAKKLKMKEVPCVCVDELTEEQVKALRIVDNKANESPWDMGMLAEELPEINLDGFDMSFGIYSYSNADLDSFFKDAEPADEERAEEKTETAKENHDGEVRCPHCGEWFKP